MVVHGVDATSLIHEGEFAVMKFVESPVIVSPANGYVNDDSNFCACLHAVCNGYFEVLVKIVKAYCKSLVVSLKS